MRDLWRSRECADDGGAEDDGAAHEANGVELLAQDEPADENGGDGLDGGNDAGADGADAGEAGQEGGDADDAADDGEGDGAVPLGGSGGERGALEQGDEGEDEASGGADDGALGECGEVFGEA